MKRQALRTRKHKLQPYISSLERLEDRFALDATSVPTFAFNAQHTSISAFASQTLEAVHWTANVDDFATSRAAHYGGPLITEANTVIYPYKTSTTGDFHIQGRSGNDGTLLWDTTTDWTPTGYNWYPVIQPVYVPSSNRVYFAGANGSLYYKDNVDTASGSTKVQLYAGVAGNVTITGLTADSSGNIYYGYRNGTVGGIVKVTSAGVVTTVTANTASQDGSVTDWIPQMNSTPALSNDGLTLYIGLRRNSTSYYGRLVGLNTSNLTTQYNSGVLKDPRSGGVNNAGLLNDSTASPVVAPDGHVFLGIFANPYNGSRGWMAHFNADLTTLNTSTPDPTDTYFFGGFGWDTTPSIVPTSMVPQYAGTAPYLLFTKYNNYYGISGGGDGSNEIAVLDPYDSQVLVGPADPDSGGIAVMKRVLYQIGPTLDWDYNPLPNPPEEVPTAKREWCINYGAVDPATQSIIVNSADGKFYRWHLPTNTLIEPVQLSSGFGQPYTMTVIGVDGQLYGIQIGKIFAMGETPRMSISDAVFAEGTGGSTTATFTVSLNYPRTTAITVNYATADGTATAGSDYTATSGSLTFDPGIKSQTITVTVGTDSLYEFNETFFVNLSAAVNSVILDGQGQGTINNDDAIPNLSINDMSVNEGNSGTTSLIFTVTLSAASGVATTVNYASANDTAGAGDYQSTSGTLNFTAGQTSKTITVLVNGDTTFESNESFFMNLSLATNANISDGQGVGGITNDDNVPSMTINNVTVAEGTTLLFTVTLSNSSSQTITVNYATADGTATSPADYGGGSATLSFNPGETSKTISITSINDTLDELNPETFVVNLSSPTNAFISDNQGVGSLQDSDPAVSVAIADLSANEGMSGTTAFNFVVSLSAASGRTVKVNYATANGTASAPGDYQTKSGTLTFLAGETSKSVMVLVNGDSINEANETFFVNLSTPVACTIADSQAIGTIVNDDSNSLSIDDVSLSEGNSGTTTFSFTVSLSSASASTITVDFSTSDGTATLADGDYSGGPGTVTFAPGETSKTISVSVNGDVLNEADETFFVNLSNPVNAAINDNQGQGTILNDDPLPSLSIGDVSVPEFDYNTGPVTVYVYLSTVSGQTVTVDYNTENGTASSTIFKDYTDTFGTITFAPGQTVASFDVSIFGDTRDEPDETIRALLSNPVNATISDDLGIITILDDDVVYVTITGASIVEGNSGQSAVQVTVDLSIPADYEITIDYETEDASALAGLDYVATNGTLTFGAGNTSQTITIQVLGDLLDELDEDFEVVLSNATPGVELGVYPEADVDILDNDTAGFLISDVTQGEGNSGTTSFVFTVSLSNPSDRTTGVSYSTANGTATAPGDYQSASGTLSFAPGVTSQSVTVLVNGDTATEPNETFFVNLETPTGDAVINDAQGVGTIANDDSVSVSINDVSLVELNTGVRGFLFYVTLSGVGSQSITVQYATADGTATTANNDYFATSGTLTFFAGQTVKFVNVQVKGDKSIEPTEVFYVNLFNATNTTIFDSQGVGTIIDDDLDVTSVIAPNDPPKKNPKGQADAAVLAALPTLLVDDTLSVSPASNSASAKLQAKDSFADLRFYVLEEGRLQSVKANGLSDDFAYAIDSVGPIAKSAKQG